jgi:hypothetical protein
MKRLLWLLLPLLLASCAIPYHVRHARYFTSLRGKLGRAHSEEEMRAAIVQVIPLGLPRKEVEHRIRCRFNTSIATDCPEETARWFPKADPKWTSICLNFEESGVFPWGFDAKEAHFLFDTHSNLRVVIVVFHSDWI